MYPLRVHVLAFQQIAEGSGDLHPVHRRIAARCARLTCQQIMTGEELKAIRSRLGFSQQMMADRIGMSLRQYAYWEAGKWLQRDRAAFTLIRIMDHLGPKKTNRLWRQIDGR